jgi:DNA-binding beta-propeller fold protein YncE
MPMVMIAALFIMSLHLPAQPFAEPQGAGGGASGGVGPGGIVTPVGQLLRPEGDGLELPGLRPVDAVMHPSGKTLYLKTGSGVSVVDAQAWKVQQSLAYPAGGGSMTGLAIHVESRETSQGGKLYVTNAASALFEATIGEGGSLAWGRTITLPSPGADVGGGAAFGCGIALSPDGKTGVVCMSRGNNIAVVDLAEGKVTRTIDVGVSPFAVVVSPDQKFAYVSNWGGRRSKDGDRTAASGGTLAVVDARGVAASGTVSIVDLAAGKAVAEIEVGLQPCALVMTRDGKRVFVAASNSDTVVELDTAERKNARTIDIRPDDKLPYGSMPAALALSNDERTLYVANAGNNAVAVVPLDGEDEASPRPAGFVPTAWLPGAIVVRDESMYVACIRGIGSRESRKDDRAFNSHKHVGTVHRVRLPDAARLRELTARALDDARVPQALASLERARMDVKPVPIPARAGEPSTIEHCIYIIKENRTYDQIFGAFSRSGKPEGRGMAKLCVFPREITPNHHALAERYVLLDNYYCNGVLSADGHSWATEGNSTTYLERSFGGFARSYTFGDDPLTYSSSGFLWDRVLKAGLSFRNYGEFAYTDETPDKTFPEIWADWQQARAGGERKITYKHRIGVENLKRFTNMDAPGWNMDIPDQIRADVFIDELKEFEKKGSFPSLVIIYLPNDHTSGSDENNPTPRALMADNDLALGRIVEAVTKSKFWPKTAIFVNEDDPQDGWDHVDGHRSICLVISPFAKRGKVVSELYNQASVIHTIERILGIASTNQRYGMMSVMSACFTDESDLAPYAALVPSVSITEMNPKRKALGPRELHWAEVSARQNFAKVDAANEDDLNRVIWHAMKGVDTPYPAEFAGAHGKGLAGLGLRPDPTERGDADGDGDSDGDDGPPKSASPEPAGR